MFHIRFIKFYKTDVVLTIFDLHFQNRYGIFKHIKGETIEAALPQNIWFFTYLFKIGKPSLLVVVAAIFFFPCKFGRTISKGNNKYTYLN